MKLSILINYLLILSFFLVDNISGLFLKAEIDNNLEIKTIAYKFDESKHLVYKFDMNFKMPPGPIFAKGWLKYASYEVNEISKPREFFKNFAFYEQFKTGQILNLNEKDNVTLKIIKRLDI